MILGAWSKQKVFFPHPKDCSSLGTWTILVLELPAAPKPLGICGSDGSVLWDSPCSHPARIILPLLCEMFEFGVLLLLGLSL